MLPWKLCISLMQISLRVFLSIHPSINVHLFITLSKGAQTRPPPPVPPKLAQSLNGYSVQGLSWDLGPVGRAWNTS